MSILDLCGISAGVAGVLSSLYLEWIKKNRRAAVVLFVIALVSFAAVYSIDKYSGDNRKPAIPTEAKPIPATPKVLAQPTKKTYAKDTSEVLVITMPGDGRTVPQNPPVEFTYAHVPRNQRLWLIVIGEEQTYSDAELYWPLGHVLFGKGRSVILDEEVIRDDNPHTWRSDMDARKAWFSSPGKHYRLELIGVDLRSDRALGREYLLNAERGFDGVNLRDYDYHSDIAAQANPVHIIRDTK